MRLMILAFVSAFLCNCVSIQSVSVSNPSSAPGNILTGSDGDLGVLRLSTPNADDLVTKVKSMLDKNCPSKNLTNFQTVLSMRDFFVVQAYTVTLTAVCTTK